jgi:TorA maturation chaperone TorD/DNA-binding transcriptional regulator YdaS (Cro superfamily)
MRDAGLTEAITAAGGVSELARRIGIAQPSLSNWSRIPAERVLQVEAVTGVSRALLRPDLFGVEAAAGTEAGPSAARPPAGAIDEIDSARAQEYALLASLLARAPDAELLTRLAQLRGDPSPLGLAHLGLADAAREITVERGEREFFDLFIGIGRGELVPYASYYLTGFLNERPLARLRDDLIALGIERIDGNYEPEDSAAMLCETMAGIVGGRFPAAPGTDQKMFEAHVAPWLGRFFADLERASAANFYRHVGAIGRLFVDIETEAFALPA